MRDIRVENTDKANLVSKAKKVPRYRVGQDTPKRESEQADRTSEEARRRALDPTLGRADVAKARQEMEDAAFRRGRMREAKRRLQERLGAARQQEDLARRTEIYQAARAERDAVAEELTEYPALVDRLVAMLARLEASAQQVRQANNQRPDGAAWLESAEAVARGLSDQILLNRLRITQSKLVRFENDALHPYAWPIR